MRAKGKTSSCQPTGYRSTSQATCTAMATPTCTSSFPSWSSRCGSSKAPSTRARATTRWPAALTTSWGSLIAASPRRAASGSTTPSVWCCCGARPASRAAASPACNCTRLAALARTATRRTRRRWRSTTSRCLTRPPFASPPLAMRRGFIRLVCCAPMTSPPAASVSTIPTTRAREATLRGAARRSTSPTAPAISARVTPFTPWHATPGCLTTSPGFCTTLKSPASSRTVSGATCSTETPPTPRWGSRALAAIEPRSPLGRKSSRSATSHGSISPTACKRPSRPAATRRITATTISIRRSPTSGSTPTPT